MPENNVPSAKPDPEVAPIEFDFADPITERPRVKRRALQDAASAAKPVESISEKKPESKTKMVSSTSAGSASSKPKLASTAQPSSPHGTRPATLYYSSSPRKDKEAAAAPTTTSAAAATPAPTAPTATPTSPMKTVPSASPTPSSSATTTSATRPASTASTARPSAGVTDYRANVDRQSREQKSVGGILSIAVYVLIFLFVSGSCLAGYGIFVLSKQVHAQSVTMSDFDQRYATDYKDVNTRLATTQDTLAQAQAQIGRQQELINKQQEMLNKLLAGMADTNSALRQEAASRAKETSAIRSRLKDLEYTGPTTRKY